MYRDSRRCRRRPYDRTATLRFFLNDDVSASLWNAWDLLALHVIDHLVPQLADMGGVAKAPWSTSVPRPHGLAAPALRDQPAARDWPTTPSPLAEAEDDAPPLAPTLRRRRLRATSGSAADETHQSSPPRGAGRSSTHAESLNRKPSSSPDTANRAVIPRWLALVISPIGLTLLTALGARRPRA